MAQFIINQAITTDVPVIEVTVSPDKPLPIGRQRFQLIVTDNSGNSSKPDVVEVIVADQDAPTAVLTVPSVTGFGKSRRSRRPRRRSRSTRGCRPDATVFGLS